METSDSVSLAALIISLLSAVLTCISTWVAWDSWKKARSKIMMMSYIGRVTEVLPAWYTERMMGDYWGFGLLTVDGTVIAIHRITHVSDDAKWMDVELMVMRQPAVVFLMKGLSLLQFRITEIQLR